MPEKPLGLIQNQTGGYPVKKPQRSNICFIIMAIVVRVHQRSKNGTPYKTDFFLSDCERIISNCDFHQQL